MHAMGVPTTRALSLVATGDQVSGRQNLKESKLRSQALWAAGPRARRQQAELLA